MQTLEQKPDTKRPVIVRAATSLFAERGIDGTSMRDIAEAAGVREAAIYRHFAGKDDLAREIFLSWYGWYSEKLQDIVSGPAGTLDKLREIVRHEFSAVTDHSDGVRIFLRERSAVRTEPSPGDRERPARLYHIHQSRAGPGRGRSGKPRVTGGHAERRAVRSRAHMASYGAAEKA